MRLSDFVGISTNIGELLTELGQLWLFLTKHVVLKARCFAGTIFPLKN